LLQQRVDGQEMAFKSLKADQLQAAIRQQRQMQNALGIKSPSPNTNNVLAPAQKEA
jgi:hypothetical protein